MICKTDCSIRITFVKFLHTKSIILFYNSCYDVQSRKLYLQYQMMLCYKKILNKTSATEAHDHNSLIFSDHFC